jgi:fructuronate reductase
LKRYTAAATRLPPFTVLSCDNIPDNGHVVKNAVLAWRKNVPQNWRSGSSMSVSGHHGGRIVPAATEESLAEIAASWALRSLRHQLRAVYSVGH